MKKKRNIFFADRAELRHIAQAVTGDWFDLKFCSSLEEAEASLRSPGNAEEVDLIACGLHFDDGRMYELLRFVRCNETTRPIPFLCVKLQKGKMTPSMLDSIKTSSAMLGAQGFVHFPDMVLKHGERAALIVFRKTLHDILKRSERRSNAHEGMHLSGSIFLEGIRHA